ncbi:MAG: sensor domain-containing diguanylate cyclase [Halopseudomonas sp.]
MTQLIDKIAIPTFVLNQHGVITHWNRALVQLTGLTSESMIGTQDQWRPFYGHARPTMADLIIQDNDEHSVDEYYCDKYRPCDVLEGAFVAEDFFPEVGEDGEWLAFTASPIQNKKGITVGAIETLLNISDRKKAELELLKREQLYRELSIIDELTQLYNSRFLAQELGREVERCKRYQQPLTLCMFDLDHFKSLNDNHGHLFGNQVLSQFGALIKRHLRTTDSGFRYGGEEFIVLMPAVTDTITPAERVRAELEQMRFTTDTGETVRVTVSAGIACYTQGDDDNSLLQRADKAMYQSKKDGRNRVTRIKK